LQKKIKNKFILCHFAFFLLAASVCFADEKKVDFVIESSFLSRYIDKGFDSFPDNHSAMVYSLYADFFESGFGLNVNLIRANTSGFENAEKMEYAVYYENALFEESRFLTEYLLLYRYNSFPDNPRRISNTHEIEMGFAWPGLSLWSFVPRYAAVVEWPAESKAENCADGGWMHIVGFEGIVSQSFLGLAQWPIVLSADFFYNDGLGCDVDHDWSHAVFGISTEFSLSKHLNFSPSLYYQSSWDDSVNTRDEWWTRLCLIYKF